MKSITATFGSYTITRAEDGKITVERFGQTCPNTKEAIRDIAEKADFDIDPKWNTRTAGAKLLKHLLPDDEADAEYLFVEYEVDPEQFQEDLENDETEKYEDDWWSIIGDVKNGWTKAEKVTEINLDKPGLYIKDLEYRTYAFVIDGDIALETDK